MGCCGQAIKREGQARADGPRTAVPAARSIADATPPARVTVAGGTGFVGTQKPVIAEDGEAPRRAVKLRTFAIDTVPVTNSRFAAFVCDTGYRTEAEEFGWAPVFRLILADAQMVPPSNTATPWWGRMDGAAWHCPEGPGSAVEERADHPVVHMSWRDARAFAAWAGGRLPSEAEWEHAARGGLDDPIYVWGDEPVDEDRLPCNVWRGSFPYGSTRTDPWRTTMPVASFPANGYGLHDMAGNVWEWTADDFKVRSLSRNAKARNALARREKHKVMKGGSFLCHESYCFRYRVAARSGTAADSGASNTGMRIVYDV